MILPIIHLNGTSVNSLADANDTAAHAIYAAIGALSATAPNARDYYPQGEEAFAQAVREHTARMAHLQAVLDELLVISEHLANNGG